MRKRFKSKKHHNIKITKALLVFLVIYISFNFTYNIIYTKYLSKLSNKDIINHIITNTKENKTSNPLIAKYKNPLNIMNNYFTFREKEVIKVDNEIKEEPVVYIYCTHETEAYKDKYLEVYNIKPTIKTMSYILKDYLEDYGINTIIEEKSITSILRENNWSYKYSYQASKLAIENKIKTTPSLKLIIDLHRDSSSLDKTLLETNNKKYARILFVIGAEHQNYEKNYEVSKKLKDILEKEIPTITRGIIKKSGPGVNGIYNQDLNPNSILIELGGQYNEIEELNNTLQVLSKSILIYLEGES